jgi:hypothetical protein
MTLVEYVKLATTILAALGGGGAIVLGLSNFLGKIWADRALQDYRHKYDELNIQLQNRLADNSRRLQAELEMISKRVQVELDALSLVHSLRTKEEFAHLAALWKDISKLGFALREMISALVLFEVTQATPEKWDEYKASFVNPYKSALEESQRFLAEHMIFIPATIAEVALDIVHGLQAEQLHYIAEVWISQPEAAQNHSIHRLDVWKEFTEKSTTLEYLIRTYIQSQDRLEVPTRYTT